VKGALFNILAPQIVGATFLDLYSGAGTIGIEALSRGAKEVVFVEISQPSIHAIKKNIGETLNTVNFTLFQRPVSTFLRQGGHGPFDIVFADPPYQSDEIEKILPMIQGGDILSDDGVFIFEHHHKKKLPPILGRLNLARQCKYGETVLSFYVKK